MLTISRSKIFGLVIALKCTGALASCLATETKEIARAKEHFENNVFEVFASSTKDFKVRD